MPSPYREHGDKSLADLIPPDRRRLKLALLVLASMLAGAGLMELGRVVVARRHVAPVQRPSADHVPAVVLSGPEDTHVSLPARRKAVVNVWLQGCQDCMGAFNAMRELQAKGGLGVTAPIVNVAYGEADPSWAARYGVRENLVFDVGGSGVVRPLGIGTFTTLVIDADGLILHRDRPDRPGYADRIRTALGEPAP